MVDPCSTWVPAGGSIDRILPKFGSNPFGWVWSTTSVRSWCWNTWARRPSCLMFGMEESAREGIIGKRNLLMFVQLGMRTMTGAGVARGNEMGAGSWIGGLNVVGSNSCGGTISPRESRIACASTALISLV